MPKVRKQELQNVVRELWGRSKDVEDQAKLVLAEQLIKEVWEADNKEGIAVNHAGTCIKQALGKQWLSAHDRQAAGKPSLGRLLADDPYFVVRTDPTGQQQPMVRLRMPRLAKLISNPELIAEYRVPAGPDKGAASSSSEGGGGRQEGAVTLTDDGLPIRPGERNCPHYMKFGWCLFKQDCWYSHPPSAKRPNKANGSPGPDRLLESELEPGVMLLYGVYPLRPGKKACPFYVNNGWCAYKAKCRLHHPPPHEVPQQGAVGRGGAVSPVADEAVAHQEDLPCVKQPPLQVLLGVIIDSVWPPNTSAAACAKGALAKYMVEQQQAVVQQRLLDEDAVITVPGPAAGSHLAQYWSHQRLYDPSVKPYGKIGLANMLDEDPLFISGRTSSDNTFTLRLGQLITHGARAASRALATIADAVWPPLSGKDAWLRGTLAKWLLQAGFEGNNGAVLRQVLAVGPDSPTVFRIDVAQAGEYLLRCWATLPHPYDQSSKPWVQLKPIIAEDRFFYIEPAPNKPNSQHVTLDLLDMLRQLPRIARAAASRDGRQQQQQQGGGAGSSTTAASAVGRQSPVAAAAASLPTAGPSSSRAASAGGAADVLDVADEDEERVGHAVGAMLQASSAAAAAASGAGVDGSGRPGADDAAAAARAKVTALESLRYMPPPEGAGSRRMQRWWPRTKPEQQGWTWTEVAVRMLSTEGPDAGARVAEMVQHLEISPVLAVACSAYAQRIHLLQFFAPYASIGGLEMPAAVYLLDILQPREDVSNFLSLVGPVLSNRENIKVCHSSKQWSGLLQRHFGLQLDHYFDTQQANYVHRALLRETSKRPVSDADLARTSEVSLSALLETSGFFHPVRHVEANKEGPKLWQHRPLSNELIACAAADVAYLIPLMEAQARQLRQAATTVRQHQAQQRGRAAQMSGLPPDVADSSVLASVAGGVEGQGSGGLSLARLGEWASLAAFHQVPWHNADG